MGNPTHRKNKMKENGGNVKDYRVWGANWFSSKFVIQYFILESESACFYP